MSLLDAKGKQIRPSLKDEDIIEAINELAKGIHQLQSRIQFQHSQITHTGLIIEYMLKELESKLDLEFDDQAFAAFAEKRIEEVQKEAQEAVKDSQNLAGTEINLNDE